MKDGRTFSEFMRDEKTVNRWLIMKVFMTGMFAGALLAVAFNLVALQ